MIKKWIGDCYLQISKSDIVKAAFRAAIAIFMVFVWKTLNGWNDHPDTFPSIDLPALATAIKTTIIVFISSLMGSYWSNSEGKLFKKDPPKDMAAVKE